jgi:hypothetical protein
MQICHICKGIEHLRILLLTRSSETNSLQTLRKQQWRARKALFPPLELEEMRVQDNKEPLLENSSWKCALK